MTKWKVIRFLSVTASIGLGVYLGYLSADPQANLTDSGRACCMWICFVLIGFGICIGLFGWIRSLFKNR